MKKLLLALAIVGSLSLVGCKDGAQRGAIFCSRKNNLCNQASYIEELPSFLKQHNVVSIETLLLDTSGYGGQYNYDVNCDHYHIYVIYR